MIPTVLTCQLSRLILPDDRALYPRILISHPSNSFVELRIVRLISFHFIYIYLRLTSSDNRVSDRDTPNTANLPMFVLLRMKIQTN